MQGIITENLVKVTLYKIPFVATHIDATIIDQHKDLAITLS